ncbi:hypothetical protein BGZ70_007020 [Mortierella alpina]|uniref:Uncharacterized protein n=1 Tax=Mortierella alpina TaxID=64518 RepID=A0A9P6J707_MORAP|nr:hypothetical protein BGZ68_007544 [Mortierella alpina]KAF9570796.1 hypothetical protein EC968_001396 [Mortierella alpina]KAF9942658.1 hypothetical protein BGZ67_000472 [Mortierella alpina]KAF9964027.1 hypothetical protein BGZ70_007020 [Mortierella alpina]KAF9984429.1 hypothetical protein BGZ75_004028 [Mortierella antarctica]
MSLVNRPNPVPHLQRLYQAPTHTPIYLRKGGDKFIMTAFAGIMTVGLLGSLYGATKMARGVKN